MEDQDRGPEDQALGALLRQAGARARPPAGARERVEAATLQALAARRRSRLHRRYAALGGLALAASVATVALLLRAPTEPPPSLRVARALDAETVDADGARAALVAGAALVPGTTVHAGRGVALALDGGSLRLDVATELRFGADGALELVVGRAYYDSHGPGGAGPAIALRTPRGVVRDLGTQFEVAASPAALRVRVREGKVEVEGVSDGIGAGVELMLDREGAAYARVALSGPEWAWAEALAPRLEIEGISADAYLRWVARESGLELRYATPSAEIAARAALLHGVLPELAPLATLEALLPATDLVHALDGNTLRIADAPR
jgi:ferric-dicitrate binding protein FerR (iron transport regulator)